MLVGAIADRATSFRVQKRSETTGFGDWFDIGLNAFGAAKPSAVALVEDVNQAGRWTYVVGTMETYSGLVEVFYYQDDAEATETLVGSEVVEIVDGVAAAAGAGAGPPAPNTALSLLEIAENRTWNLHDCNGTIAARILTVAEGSNEWLSMDFGDVLDNSDSVESITAVTDVNSEVTVADSKIGANRREVHVSLSGYNAGRQSKIKVTAATAQGQTIVGQGVLTVE